jgi:hypothetical protein
MGKQSFRAMSKNFCSGILVALTTIALAAFCEGVNL